MKFARFMSTPVGRIARIAAGLALVVLAVTTPTWWTIALAALGVVFIIAGVFNVCFIAPILRVPFRAKNLPTQ
jgi:membrane-bound ClpP family serine protease